ncbi:hypothetical protein ABK040_007609 [Willaertia magna]
MSKQQPKYDIRLEVDELSDNDGNEEKRNRLKNLLRNDEYKFNYPLFNYDLKNYKKLPYIDPRFNAFQQGVEDSFSFELSKYRDITNNHIKPIIFTSLLSNYFYFINKNYKYGNGMLFLTFNLIFSYFYFNNLSYGNMINRINIETHKILNHERKFYFLSNMEREHAYEELQLKIDQSINSNTCNRK